MREVVDATQILPAVLPMLVPPLDLYQVKREGEEVLPLLRMLQQCYKLHTLIMTALWQ